MSVRKTRFFTSPTALLCVHGTCCSSCSEQPKSPSIASTPVTEGDILQAEKSYSEDLLLTTAFELGDTYPQFGNILYQFEGGKRDDR